jgi:4-diphosphocytidyl-2-C-methyl-D-erythritol kinase
VFLTRDAGHAEEVAAALRAGGVCRDALPAHGPVAGARVL